LVGVSAAGRVAASVRVEQKAAGLEAATTLSYADFADVQPWMLRCI